MKSTLEIKELIIFPFLTTRLIYQQGLGRVRKLFLIRLHFFGGNKGHRRKTKRDPVTRFFPATRDKKMIREHVTHSSDFLNSDFTL
jgi:hypothetical protein